MYKKLIVIGFFLAVVQVSAQSNWMFKGYLKGMTAMQSIEDQELSLENTLHNRIDLSWYAGEKLTFTVGMRNRVIAGNNFTLIPAYSDYLSEDNGFLDLTLLWADQTSWAGISQLDRLFIDYTAGTFEITLGRQRINWGQTFVWNPNDLFNTYSYFDFDYEEKPGSDAVRLQYYLNESAKLEWTTAMDHNHKVTSALLYRMNTHGFDLQFLSGIYSGEDFVVGGGWAGSIKGGGFSGEITYYHPMDADTNDKAAVTATVHYDYTFKNSLMLQFESLYNGFGNDSIRGGMGEIIFMDLNPKSLFPTQFALFTSGSYQLSPLFYLTLAGMYGPQGDFFYLGPSLSYSMSDNIELAAFGQYFSMENAYDLSGNPIPNSGSAGFVRLKWSF